MNEKYETIQVGCDAKKVWTISLNRPKVHNAFNEEMIQEISNALEVLGTEPSVRTLILRGNGKSFCAGADLNWMQRAAQFSAEENRADAMKLGKMLHLLYTFPRPTIAVVQGSIFGGGVGLAASCDLAIAADNSVFSLSEVRLGLIPAVISPYVVSAIGGKAAKRYFLTGERFDAETAVSLGIVSCNCSLEQVESRLQHFIGELLQGGPEAQGKAKELIDKVQTRKADSELIELTANAIAQVRTTKEAREGIAAFFERRKPDWQDNF